MKTKFHIVIIVTLSLVWVILSADGDVALAAWGPPIGIPADVSGNGEVSAYDASLIAQYAVGLIDKFPIE